MARPLYLSEADHDRVSAAVASAEAGTSGEVVTVLTDRSDGYSDVRLAWAAGLALLKLLALALLPDLSLSIVHALLGGWNVEWTPRALFALASFSASLAFAFVWLVQGWDPLRFALIPAIVKTDRVHESAIRAFRMAAERRTQGRTGILIYLSMREHRAEIVADEAIATRVDPDVWAEAMAAIVAHLKDGRIADGMIAGIGKVGAVLEPHLPVAPDDRNELPDRLIEV